MSAAPGRPHLKSDLHTHTAYSHGKGSPEENVRAAIERGLTRIAISEHAGGHVFYGVRGEKLLALRREVDALAKRYAGDIEVLMGLECNLTAYGRCDAPDDRSMFDVLLLGFHKGVIPRDALARKASLEALGLSRGDGAAMAGALLAAADKYKIDILSHPGIYAHVDVPLLAKGAKELGVLLEVNSSHVNFTADELKIAASYGACFSVNSDAHSPERVGDFAASIAAIEAAGVEASVEGWIF